MKYNFIFKNELTNAFKVIGMMTLAIFCILFLMNGKLTWDNIKLYTRYNFYYGMPLSLINGYFYDRLEKIYTWEDQAKKRIWLGILGSIILTMLTLVILNYLLWVVYWGNDVSVVFSERNRLFYVIALIITIIISSILYAINFYKALQESHLITERLRKEKLQMELNALKSHIDPHFLFNSFNVLYGLIDEDPKKAQSLLNKLSDIYRYILENRNENTNTLKDELEFANKYLEFQQTRFENSIIVDTDVDQKLMQFNIPSLSLQLLLENAIKHNAFSEALPLKIEIFDHDQKLVVKNNKRARKNLVRGSGLGLNNIRDRYALLIDTPITLEDKQHEFVVELPLIVKP